MKNLTVVFTQLIAVFAMVLGVCQAEAGEVNAQFEANLLISEAVQQTRNDLQFGVVLEVANRAFATAESVNMVELAAVEDSGEAEVAE